MKFPSNLNSGNTQIKFKICTRWKKSAKKAKKCWNNWKLVNMKNGVFVSVAGTQSAMNSMSSRKLFIQSLKIAICFVQSHFKSLLLFHSIFFRLSLKQSLLKNVEKQRKSEIFPLFAFSFVLLELFTFYCNCGMTIQHILTCPRLKPFVSLVNLRNLDFQANIWVLTISTRFN